jgi:hypothetical protein
VTFRSVSAIFHVVQIIFLFARPRVLEHLESFQPAIALPVRVDPGELPRRVSPFLRGE